MAQAPVVLNTSPANNAIEVATNTTITVDFNIDLDSQYVTEEFVYLTDDTGVRVKGLLQYRRKKILFTPEIELEPKKVYKFYLIGDSTPMDGKPHGLRNIIGDPMLGNFVVTFTTEAKKVVPTPVLLSPADLTIVRTNPVFEWKPVDGISRYQIRISLSNTFDKLVFPEDPKHVIYDTKIEPNEKWMFGIYYWSVRAVDENDRVSEWSPTYQFHLTDVTEGKIAEEDAAPIEVMYEEAFDYTLELVQVHPSDGSLRVDPKTKSFYFRVIGEIDISSIDVNFFEMRGTHVTEDVGEVSHGVVKGVTSIAQANDGTTYIVFTPDPLPDEEGV